MVLNDELMTEDRRVFVAFWTSETHFSGLSLACDVARQEDSSKAEVTSTLSFVPLISELGKTLSKRYRQKFIKLQKKYWEKKS